MRPKIAAAAALAIATNASARASTPVSPIRGMVANAVAAARVIHTDTTVPPAAPATAMIRTSRITAATICARDAPIAARIANSGVRRCSCTSTRPATFAIAMTNSSATAAKTSSSGRR
jgi:hypothetical protein